MAGALLTEIAVTAGRRVIDSTARCVQSMVDGRVQSVMYRAMLLRGGEKGGTRGCGLLSYLCGEIEATEQLAYRR